MNGYPCRCPVSAHPHPGPPALSLHTPVQNPLPCLCTPLSRTPCPVSAHPHLGPLPCFCTLLSRTLCRASNCSLTPWAHGVRWGPGGDLTRNPLPADGGERGPDVLVAGVCAQVGPGQVCVLGIELIWGRYGLLGRDQVRVCTQGWWWEAEAVGGKAERMTGVSRGACFQSRGQRTPRSGKKLKWW